MPFFTESIIEEAVLVQDGATVPIYHESRFARLELDEAQRPQVDLQMDQVTEGEEVERKEQLKTRWAQLEALVGTEKRLVLIARDLIEHFERRQGVPDGKAMIVCMSRRICIDLYNTLIALRPDWHSQDDNQGALKIAMTGSASDDLDWQQHIRNKARRADLAEREPTGDRAPRADLDHAIRQIVSGAIVSDEVINIFAAADLQKPDLSILSDEFLAELRGMPQRNLAVELLRKLLGDEIKRRGRKNLVQARSFAAMLEEAVRRYQNRAIETVQIIEELIALAQDMRQADVRGEMLGLTEDEIAFYDAMETNDSAVQVLGDETLRTIARELVQAVKSNVTIDWAVRENVRAHMRVIVKRILRRFGYPPDKQEKATLTVLEQAEALSEGWAAVLIFSSRRRPKERLYLDSLEGVAIS